MEQYDVTGMSCAACSARVEKAVKAVDGVKECSVSLLTSSMVVDGTASPDDVIAAVKKAGYGASLKGAAKNVEKQETGKDESDETKKLIGRLVSSAVLLLVLMYFSMGHTMWGFPLPLFLAHNALAMGLIQLLLTIAVMIINGKFFTSGFSALARRAPNMDSLIALGSSAAFIYSTYMLFVMTASDAETAMHHLHGLYFESAAMILALITVGKTLEARSKGKTTSALKALINLAPKTANVIRDGKEVKIKADELKVGDIFVVYPGENIPCDGVVEEGSSAVNESALTGESIPVDKTVGDSISAATLNTSGFIKCRATRVGEDTSLSQIIKTVTDAAATKAPIAKVADKVSGIFVPTVICIALVTAAVWLIVGKGVGYALARAISVLVISCPCALGLATPVAIMVGSGVGARNGILFKTAAALEETGRADIAVLDKTGTVTNGMPVVTDILPVGTDEKELIKYANSLESKSEHPLAKAITKYALESGTGSLTVDDFSVHSGFGLSAACEGKELCGGNIKYISEKAEITAETAEKADKMSAEGKTPMFFSLGDKLLGIIAVADTLRDDGREAIEGLKKLGVKTVMLTGDNERTAKAVAAKAGIDEVVADVLPTGKESEIRKYSGEGKTVMVGDGINDAPALTAANVGIAIGAGTDVAIDAADVVLMKSRALDIPASLCLGRAVLRNIHENLFWAFIYNIIGIPLAAGVFIPLFSWELNPMFGAAAMSLSSFCVVSNALRLNFINVYDFGKYKRSPKIKKFHKGEDKMEKTFNVEGMMCAHCEAHVKKALESIDGVKSATADHASGKVVVEFEKNVPADEMIKAIKDAGYTVK